jgi:hypothetical protein
MRSVAASPPLLLTLVLLAASVELAFPHGLMLTPPARSASDGLLHRGGSMWYTQSATIGCREPNITVGVHLPMHAGDLCPNDHSGAARGLPGTQVFSTVCRARCFGDIYWGCNIAPARGVA